MKKLLKGNNKGFVLVETLIATVFVAAIFSIIYINFFPLMGEYEKRENYDDVDSKYGTFWVKRMVEDSKYNPATVSGAPISYIGYKSIDCSILFPDTSSSNYHTCDNLYKKLKIKSTIITPYKITVLKQHIKNNATFVSSFSEGMKEYIKYLPEYDNYHSLYDNDYRVIVEFERTDKDGLGNEITYNTFSTMEVNK